MSDETLADGIYYCEHLAPTHPGVAALLAEYKRMNGYIEFLRREIALDAQIMPQDAAEIARLRDENERLRAALEAVEWIEYMASETYCPWCNAEPCKGDKHAADCQRQVALGIAP